MGRVKITVYTVPLIERGKFTRSAVKPISTRSEPANIWPSFDRRSPQILGLPRRTRCTPEIRSSYQEHHAAGGGPNTSTALRPPNANEFDIVYLTGFSRPTLGT